MPPENQSLTPEEAAAFQRSVEQIRRSGARQLDGNRNGWHEIEFVGQLQDGIDKMTQLATDQGVTPACRQGCSHCCHARVSALPPEVFRIAHTLQTRPLHVLETLVGRLRAHAAISGTAANWQQRPPCPFLENGLCTIYAVRPGACRRAHSLDARACAAHAAHIPQSLKLLAGAEALLKGTAAAYADAGLHAAGTELTGAVLLALTDAAAETRWCNGADVFAGLDI